MVQLVNHPATLSHSAPAELRAYLARQDMTINAASAKIGVTPSWLQRRLNGRISPTLADVDRICTGLGIPVSEVVR